MEPEYGKETVVAVRYLDDRFPAEIDGELVVVRAAESAAERLAKRGSEQLVNSHIYKLLRAAYRLTFDSGSCLTGNSAV